MRGDVWQDVKRGEVAGGNVTRECIRGVRGGAMVAGFVLRASMG